MNTTDDDQPVGECPEIVPWTLTHIRQAARVTCARVRTTNAAARTDLNEVAQSAVGLAVAENPRIPWNEAISIAARAVYDAATTGRESHGINSLGKWKPRFFAYWTDDMHHMPDPTRCLDRLALEQVMSNLPERHIRTLWARAFADSNQMAAAAQGVSSHTYDCRLTAARKAALALLFDEEQPPPLSRLTINQRKIDRTCSTGHLIAGDNVQVERVNGRIVERCRTCRQNQNRAYKAKVKAKTA